MPPELGARTFDVRAGETRHAQADPEHPRPNEGCSKKDVDGRDTPGHDEK
jgi:hypothetical protein